MGIQNRQRRAAKAKRRSRDRARRGNEPSESRARTDERHGERPHGDRRWHPGAPSADVSVRELFELAAVARLRGDGPARAQLIDALGSLNPHGVLREAEAMLARFMPRMWSRGWQPAEFVRHVRRKASAASITIVRTAVAADHAGRDPNSLDPRWAAQVESLQLPRVDGGAGWLRTVVGEGVLRPAEWIGAVIDTVAAVLSTSPLEVLIPPPGTAPSGTPQRRVARDSVADPLLTKVRALLAQAESTNFPAEAEAFTAKAQALMARHAIDAALVWEATDDRERPVTIRIPIDDPYADAKGLLLHVVAGALRCKPVLHSNYGLVSVLGFASDLTSVEVLFTSLLVQSQTALQAEARSAPPGSRVRSRPFRASYLSAYALRIGERLAEVTAAVTSDAESDLGEHGRSLFPVLASRSSAIDDAFHAMFPGTSPWSVSLGWDTAGHARGRAAADKATLVAGALPEEVAV